jgi:amidase
VSILEGWPDGVDPMTSYQSFGFQVELFLATQQPGAPVPDFATFLEQDKRRLAMRAAWAGYFRDIDVFVCPANFTVAFPHDHRPMEQRTVNGRSYMDQTFWIAHASLAGLPAVAAPIGQTAAGLPAGIQVMGPAYEDDTALTFAELLAGVLR